MRRVKCDVRLLIFKLINSLSSQIAAWKKKKKSRKWADNEKIGCSTQRKKKEMK